MLDQEYRPKRFSDMVGQDDAVLVMRSAVKSPDMCIRSYVFHGEQGTGKTSLGGVFARALLCEHRVNGDACLECESCKNGLGGVGYSEVDVAQVGKVDFIRQFKENLFYSNVGGYRVVVLDEIQSASSSAQDALLKLLEEAPRNIFFILNTTDIDKIKDTIIGRSIPLAFSTVSDFAIKSLLQRIIEKESMVIDAEVVDRIVLLSFGHVRSAVKRLNLYQQMGNRDEFLRLLRMPDADIIDLFLSIRSGDKINFELKMASIMSFPLSHLRRAFEVFALNCLREFSGCSTSMLSNGYRMVLSAYGGDVINFPGILSKDWVYNCFKSDVALQGFLWYMFNVLGTNKSQSEIMVGDRFKKR